MIKPNNDWKDILSEEFDKPYYKKLTELVEKEYVDFTVYPPPDLIFRALDAVGYNEIKIVILGQDPYHGENQANGIAFAVNEPVPLPPSLVNIYKEIEKDLGVKMSPGGTLTGWAKQGVLLLNTTLTVRKAEPQSHSDFGWKNFTDAVIEKCSDRQKPMVFMLWGSGSIAKRNLIAPYHYVLTAPHPSPLSAHRGFFGCRHFSKANEFLKKLGDTPVDWTDVSGEDPPFYYKRNESIFKV